MTGEYTHYISILKQHSAAEILTGLFKNHTHVDNSELRLAVQCPIMLCRLLGYVDNASSCSSTRVECDGLCKNKLENLFAQKVNITLGKNEVFE